MGTSQPNALRRARACASQVEDEQFTVRGAQIVVLVFGALGGLLLMIAPFFPALMTLAPIAILFLVAAWFLVAAQAKHHGAREFLNQVEEVAHMPAGGALLARLPRLVFPATRKASLRSLLDVPGRNALLAPFLACISRDSQSFASLPARRSGRRAPSTLVLAVGIEPATSQSFASLKGFDVPGGALLAPFLACSFTVARPGRKPRARTG